MGVPTVKFPSFSIGKNSLIPLLVLGLGTHSYPRPDYYSSLLGLWNWLDNCFNWLAYHLGKPF